MVRVGSITKRNAFYGGIGILILNNIERSKLYTHDGDGNLVKSVVNGVTTFYPSTSYQEEGDKTAKYYSLGGQRVAVRQTTGASSTLNYLITDHLGSANVTTNADGTLASEIRYAPFGETRFTNGSTPTDYRYTGQLQQAEVGLYFYNARWYEPVLGRFIQADTIVPNASNPKEYDRFSYALNNPIKFIDPSGHQACWDEHAGDPGCNGYVPTAQGIVSPAVYHQQTGYWVGNSANISNNAGGRNSNNTNNAGGGNAKMPTSIPTANISQNISQGWANFSNPIFAWAQGNLKDFSCPSDNKKCYDPDAILWGVGFSGSAPGLNLAAGMEEVVIRESSQRATYVYGGQGESAGLGASALIFGGLVLNIKNPNEFSGQFGEAGVTFSYLDVGLSVSHFWDASKGPFSPGTTQGYIVGYAPGAHASIWWNTTISVKTWQSK